MMVSDGAKGSDGKGISTIIHHYLVTNVTTGVTTSTSGWKTSPTSVTVTNKYLWYYQTINYTTGNPTNTTPAIIGVYGDTGGKGETGKGIKSVTPEYYLSTSNTTQTGGSWKTTQDAWSSGKYYWTRDSINWNDGSTTTTTPTLATGLNNANSTANNAQTIANQTASKFQWIVKSGNSATDFTLTDRTAQLVADHINLNGLVTFKGLDSNTQNKITDANNKIDNLQIGGRNLLKNTGFKNIKESKELYVDNKYTKFSNNTLKLICDNTSGTSQKYTVVNNLTSTWDLADVLGQDITISMWIYIETVGQLDGYEFRILYTHNGKYQWFNPNRTYPVCVPSVSELKVGWNYIYATFSVAEDSTEVNFNFTCNSRPGQKSICWISSPKAEFGNKPTAWTPAPEDKANQSIIDNWAKDSVVNGETVINGGYIKTNTIKTDQLAVDDIFATGSAAMNIINAQEINANRITSGLLSAERINAYGLSILNKTTNQQTFNISNNGEVTIRGSVSSGNYVEGKTGWAINNNGTAEFNDIVARGSVITNDGGVASSGGVRFWAGGSYNERESAPWIVYSDGSMKATQGEFSGVFSGTVDIGNIKIADPSSTAGGDALLTIQNGQNGIKRVQLTDSSASRFAQDIIIADDHDADKISLKQDGTAVIHTGINVGNNVILNGKSLFMNNNELTTTDDGVSYLFKSNVTLGTSVGPANLIVNGNANANDVTVNEHLYFGSNVKITKVLNGVNIDVIK